MDRRTSATRCWRRPRVSPRVAEVAPGKSHSIPSRDECRACHDSGRTEILGFTALQLSTDRDPLAPHAEALTPDMVTLQTLVDEARLAPPRPELLAAPPRIAARDARERAVLGYLSTNCGSCHNPKSSIASLGLFLQHAADRPPSCAPDAITTTVGQPGHWVVPTAPEGASRLVHAGRPGAERRRAPREVAAPVEPDAADRHRGRGSRGPRAGQRLDRRRTGRGTAACATRASSTR